MVDVDASLDVEVDGEEGVSDEKVEAAAMSRAIWSRFALPLPLWSTLGSDCRSRKYSCTVLAQPGFFVECNRTGTPKCRETDSAYRINVKNESL